MTTKPHQRGPAQPLVDEREQERGSDVKKARGLSPDAGHSPHEVGMDQRVEDALRAKAKRQTQGKGSGQ